MDFSPFICGLGSGRKTMLGFNILFGYCISSFVYRRRHNDRFQKGVFAFFASVPFLIGKVFHDDINTVVLVHLPVCLVLAMIISAALHWSLRCMSAGLHTPEAQFRQALST